MSDAPDVESVDRSGVFSPGRRLLTSGLILVVTMVAFESMAVATVMPLVEDDLGDLALYGWVFSAFFLGTLIGVVVAGTASDRMRPAIPFAIGLVLFSIGLMVGGLAPTMLVLVLGRALQGLGAGAMPAISYVCIGRSYRPEQRPKMFALISSAWMVPSVVGPLIAAWVGQSIGWRWVFLGLLPLCASIGAIALIGVRTVPAPDVPSEERNIFNAVRVAAGAGLLLAGLGSRTVFIAVPLSIIGIVILVPAFRRLTPQGTLTASAGLPATVAVRGLLNFGFFAADAFVPFAIASVKGLPTVVGGLALTAGAIMWTVGSWLQARWIERSGAATLVVSGLSIVAVGAAGMLLILIPAVPGWVGLVAWGVSGLGMGLAYSPLAHVALELAGAGQEGRVTTALQLSDTLGVALGTGIAGVLVASAVSISDSEVPGLVCTFALAACIAVIGAVLGRRVPGRRQVASQEMFAMGEER